MRRYLIALACGALFVGCSKKAYEGDLWWQVDTDGGESGEGGFDDDDDDDDDDDEEDDGRIFWGEGREDGSEGAVGYFEARGGSLICEMEYPVTAMVAVDDCTSCLLAFEMTLGELEIFEDDGEACASSGYAELAGTTLRVGGNLDALFIDDGQGWAQVPDGYGEVEDGWFFFDVFLDGEGEDEEEDEEEE